MSDASWDKSEMTGDSWDKLEKIWETATKPDTTNQQGGSTMTYDKQVEQLRNKEAELNDRLAEATTISVAWPIVAELEPIEQQLMDLDQDPTKGR